MILKTNNKSEGTGQKSSDDEVSEFVIPNNERMIFGNKSVWMPYLSVRECLYSMWETITCLVTVPISEVTSITAMEVTLVGICIPQRLLDLTSDGLTHLTPGGILSRLRFNMFRVTTSSVLHGRTNEVALDEHNPAFFLFFGWLIRMRYDLVDFHYTINNNKIKN